MSASCKLAIRPLLLRELWRDWFSCKTVRGGVRTKKHHREPNRLRTQHDISIIRDQLMTVCRLPPAFGTMVPRHIRITEVRRLVRKLNMSSMVLRLVTGSAHTHDIIKHLLRNILTAVSTYGDSETNTEGDAP